MKTHVALPGFMAAGRSTIGKKLARELGVAFYAGDDLIVQKRPIKVGVLNKTVAIIDDGLQSGEQVVTDGQYRIQAGAKVEILTQTAASRG